MSEKLLTNPEDILNADDFRYTEVSVPEWGGKVRVKSMSASQRDILSKAIKEKGESEAAELALVMCIVDEEGNRVFRREHIAGLKKKSVAPISRVMAAIGELSGGKAEDIDRHEENFEETPIGDSLID